MAVLKALSSVWGQPLASVDADGLRVTAGAAALDKSVAKALQGGHCWAWSFTPVFQVQLAARFE